MKHDTAPKTRFRLIAKPWAWVSLLCLGLFAPATHADIQRQAQAMLRAANLRKTQYSLCAKDVQTGQILIQIHSENPMIPASNMKLLTTAAALAHLGPNFMFKTPLQVVQRPNQSGVSLLIRGDGDPSLGDPTLLRQHGMVISQLLDMWVQAVRQAGFNRLDHLILDDRIFDREYIHPSWPKDQLQRWYCAPVAGINFHDNCLNIYPRPTHRGDAPLLRISPEADFFTLRNRAVTGKTDSFWISRNPHTHELTFHGVVRHARIKPIYVTLENPPLFLGNLLREKLIKAGIQIGSVMKPDAHELFSVRKTLHVIQTTLPIILARCNKDSQNLFAEALIKRMGRQVTGSTGSWKTGQAAMRLFLRKRLGAGSVDIHIDDGSGLSRLNRVSANAMVNLLISMYQDPKLGPTYLASLSVNGQDGTLAKRLTRGLHGRVYGKTGYIRAVSTLSGYLQIPAKNAPSPATKPQAALKANRSISAQSRHPQPPPRRTIAFSFLFNNFKAPLYVHQIKAVQDKLVRLLDKEASR